MSSPPPKKKKIGPQLTLFGGIASGNAVHSTAKNSYKKFVNAFVCRNLHELPSKAAAVSKAQEKWKEVKADGEKIDEYIKEVEQWKKGRSEDASSWFVQPSLAAQPASRSSTASQSVAAEVAVPCVPGPSISAHGGHALSAFIQELELISDELFTEDILQQLVFMKEIKELARAYAAFRSARNEYRSIIPYHVTVPLERANQRRKSRVDIRQCQPAQLNITRSAQYHPLSTAQYHPLSSAQYHPLGTAQYHPLSSAQYHPLSKTLTSTVSVCTQQT